MKPSLVSKFSLWFTSNYRITLIMIAAVLGLGGFAYFSLLPREGFPPIQFPASVVSVAYFVDDAQQVDQQIGSVVERVLNDYPEVSSLNGTANSNFYSAFVQYEEGTNVVEITEEIRADLELANLPEAANLNISPILIDKFENEFDILLSFAIDAEYAEVQELAADFAAELQSSSAIEVASEIELITNQVNPITGESFEFQENFNRAGYKGESGDIEFSNSVLVGVVKSDPDQNALDFSKAVQDAVNDTLGAEDSEFANAVVLTAGDVAESLEQQINSLQDNAISALVVVVVVLLLLVNWRSAIIGAIFIPLVMAGTFLGLYAIGASLNVISLFALILVLGLFVDDAIVVVEAIDYQRKQGKKGKDAIIAAINGVGVADILGTITTLLVFAPLLFVGGILGEFTRAIPTTVIIALSVSIFFGLAVIPFLSRVILLPKNGEKGDLISRALSFTDWIVDTIANGVKTFVRLYVNPSFSIGKWVKIRPGVILLILVGFALVGLGGSTAANLEFSVFPPPKDANQLVYEGTFPEDTTLEDAVDYTKQVEAIVAAEIGDQIKEVTYDSANLNGFFAIVDLVDLTERDLTTSEMQLQLDKAFEQLEEVEAKTTLVGVGGPPEGEYQFSMQLYGENIEVLEGAAEEIRIFVDEYEFEVSAEVLESRINGTESIVRLNGDRFVTIQAKLSEDADTSALLSLQEAVAEEFDAGRLEELGLADDAIGNDLGIESDFLGSLEQLLVATLLALILMYVLLVALYRSYLQPILIFLAIPFSFVLLFPGLQATDNSLGFLVTLGITGLVGIVVNNSILLVDYANQLRAEGMDAPEAIANAVSVRFRPLVTTTVTTVAGIIPLISADPFWEGLGLSIVFGLISSTLLVVLVFPAFYVITESTRNIKRNVVSSVQRIL